ncbi:MAG: hypothetical protein RL497_2461, partial [Pseudomonadota bacterium]
MHLNQHVCLMAEYNRVMNTKFYAVAASLPQEALHENKGAFFGSIFGTLNHIAVGDIFWLKRIAQTLPACPTLNPMQDIPWPESLSASVAPNLEALTARRIQLDGVFDDLSAALTEEDLVQGVRYKNIKGDLFNKKLFSVLMHVFNHQTHHRGQITTLFAQ